MEKRYDILVIGSGIAGLFFALKLADRFKILIVTKQQATVSNTYYAQGGIAAPVGKDDSVELHIQDTLETGRGLSREAVVRRIISYASQGIRELMDMGVQFTGAGSNLELGKEGGHSRERIVHVKDFTGKAIEERMVELVRSHPNIDISEHSFAIDLITQHHLRIPESRKKKEAVRCFGAYVLNTKTGEIDTVLARYTLLASGGCGRVYFHTTNPPVATGDGIAMAFRAGARVANMEFIQFHPTKLYNPSDTVPFLISEAVRGAGGILRRKDGSTFMEKYNPKRELAPRDIVARAIDHELKTTGAQCVYLDVTHLDQDFVKSHFPTIYEHCLSIGIDITKEWIPVVPAAHYMCGGVVVDENGRTDIEKLYASGEVAYTGLHGANRLASNSLLESLAISHFAAEDIRQNFGSGESVPPVPPWDTSGVFDSHEWVVISHNRLELEHIMWDYVGIVRSDRRLNMARDRIEKISCEVLDFYSKNPVRQDLVELRNLVSVAELIVRSALARKESRGLHYNVNYPYTSEEFKKDTILKTS
ncbi:MAG: L-aspartate oxidase [candidate division Zixibacteria bacterium 4484_93]|nr:MAG: L-aspartate oxidase [candidate division Zixibacteria bacterium 4484_93]